MRPEARNRAHQHRRDAFTDTNLVRHVFRQPFVGRAPHKVQGLLDSRFRQDVEIWGLLQLQSHRLLQSAIEDRLARSVDEVTD
jgi:hypothetical protein